MYKYADKYVYNKYAFTQDYGIETNIWYRPTHSTPPVAAEYLYQQGSNTAIL